MARYGRRSYRRRYRRGRKLTKASIYGNRSARSQAGQIARLNSKVNYIARRTKPEIHVLNSGNFDKSFTSNAFAATYYLYQMPLPTAGSAGDSGFAGNQCHMISLTLHGYAEYFNSSATGYHDSESAGCVLRIIALQTKSSVDQQLLTTPTDILQSVGTSGTGYTALAYAPFRTGISDVYRVLMDYKCTLTSDKNQKLLKLKVPLGKYRTLSYDPNLQKYSNSISILVLACGLHYDQNFTETIQYTSMLKLVFRDN